MLATQFKFPLVTTSNPVPVLCPRAHPLLPLWLGLSKSLCALCSCACSSSSLQKDRQRQAPQTRRQATSLRAATGPSHLESDLARGGWKRDLLSHLDREPWHWPSSLFSEPRVPGKQGQTERHPQRLQWPLPWEGPLPTPTGFTLPPPHRAQVHF